MTPTGHAVAVSRRRRNDCRRGTASRVPPAGMCETPLARAPALCDHQDTPPLGVRDSHVQALSVGSVALCVSLWIRAKTVDQDERGNAERRAIFVGLWAPTLWGIAISLREREGRRSAWSRRRL